MPPGDEPPARVGRRQVRGDRILPEPEPREDVRGHVEGVRRVRGDPGVGAGRGEGIGGKLRIVERVDHVMRDAGMLRLEGQEGVQDRGRLLLVREARVARRRRAEQRQGVEDLRFMVVGQLLRELPDGIAVGLRAGLVIEPIGVAIEGADRGDVSALPLGLCIELRGLSRGGRSRRQLLRIRRGPDRVVPGHRDSPVGHRARGILRRDGLERPPRFLVAEGVQESDGARELGVDPPAGGRKVDASQGLHFAVGVLVFLRQAGRREQQAGGESDRKE